jgi:DNA-binding IscR family transcriptional regulator
LWDVLAAVEPVGELGNCLLGEEACRGEVTCPLHNDWAQVRNQIAALLRNKTLADFAAEAKQSGCCRLGAGGAQPCSPPWAAMRK